MKEFLIVCKNLHPEPVAFVGSYDIDKPLSLDILPGLGGFDG